MYDFYEEVLKRKDDILQDIITVCKIPSILDEKTAGENQPFGKPCLDVLETMLNIGKRDGFEYENVDGYAGHIDIGEGEETLGILGHLDVVPVNDTGWNTDPFQPTIINNVLYGRGVADDKGPLLAAYWAAKIVNEIDIAKKRKIRVIFGCNEESGCACLQHYFSKKPFCTLGFTPDSDFPAIYGEKAICRLNLTGTYDEDNIIGIYAGSRPNIVPETCEAYVVGNYKNYQDSFQQYLDKYHLDGHVEEEGNHTKLVLVGVGSHGSTPELGKNGAVYMCHYLKTISDNKFVDFIDHYLFEDVNGIELGFKQNGRLGKPTINLGIITYKNHKGSLVLDLRLSDEITKENVKDLFDKAIQPYDIQMEMDMGNALYIDPDSELVSKLHQAYIEFSGDQKNQPQAIGGGTYAKEMPNCVAFGAQFPGENNHFHENNERISIDSLLKATTIYAKAIYELIKA